LYHELCLQRIGRKCATQLVASFGNLSTPCTHVQSDGACGRLRGSDRAYRYRLDAPGRLTVSLETTATSSSVPTAFGRCCSPIWRAGMRPTYSGGAQTLCQLGQTTRIAPLVIVPGQHLGHCAPQHHCGRGIHNG